jgi:hypothetical protein
MQWTAEAPHGLFVIPSFRSSQMQFSILIGTSRKKVVQMLVAAAALVLGGLILGAADDGDWVPSGWVPAVIGLLLAATALYRLLARPVVMTIDQAGIRAARQIQLLPWGRIVGVRGFSRSGLTPFLIIRAAECKTIPGFTAGRAAAGLAAPKVEADEIALNLTGASARVDELVQAIEHLLALVAASQDESAEPADPLSDPVIQRVADSNAASAGAIRWLATIFGPVFGIFTVWALLAWKMTEAGDVVILLIVAAAAAGAWLIAGLIIMIVRTTSDRCPKCKLAVRYFKDHAGRPLTCPGCRHAWPAGVFKIR